MPHDFSKIIRVDEIRLENVECQRSTHSTTDYRRKVLCVHFDNGFFWVPKDKDIDELVAKKDEAFKWNMQFPDPDKSKEQK
jgi:hypothetical protein